MTFKQLWRLISLSLCLILSGCLHMDVVFTIQADGSGTITETTHWPAGNPMLRQFGGKLPPMGVAKLEERARSIGPGVKVSEQSQVGADGQVDHTLTYLVPDFNQVHYSLDQGKNKTSHGLQYRFEMVRKAGQPSKLTVNNDPFVTSLFDQAKAPDQTQVAATASDSLRQFMAASMQALAGTAVDIKLKLASEPLKSTAAFQDGQVTTLFHMDVDQLTAKPDWQTRMFAKPAPRATGTPCTYADEPGMRVDCQSHIDVWLR